MIERRRSMRVECEIESTIRDLDSENPAKTEIAIIKNISRGGVRIRVDAFIPIQDRLFIHVRLPNHKVLEIQAAPSWIVELPHLGKYDVGVRFVEMTPEDEDVVQDFQYKALLEKMPFRANVVKDLLKDNPDPNPPA